MLMHGPKFLYYTVQYVETHCYVVAAVVLSPVVATTTLSDPGPLCAGQTAVLTCSVTDGVTIDWFYRNGCIGPSLALSQPPSSDPVTVGGVEFTLTLSQNSNPLISQLSFIASPDMDGGVVRCTGGIADGTFLSDEITLQVEMICKSIVEWFTVRLTIKLLSDSEFCLYGLNEWNNYLDDIDSLNYIANNILTLLH